jgi:REP element-mobilizing transposase RayT
VDHEIQLSEIGKIAEQEWLKSPSLRPDMNLDMEIFQIMPNHIHGIIVIGRNEYNSMNHNDTHCRDAMHLVSSENVTEQIDETIRMIEQNPSANHFGLQSKNLASILRGFKSAVTIEWPTIRPDFAWQVRFYAHVIHENDEFRRIAY